jgi:hypothetical protein
VERSFAHVCETGGARRVWLWGIEKVRKRYLIAAVAHNLGCLMRALFGMGTPRGLQRAAGALAELMRATPVTQMAFWSLLKFVGRIVSHQNSFLTSTPTHAPAAA